MKRIAYALLVLIVVQACGLPTLPGAGTPTVPTETTAPAPTASASPVPPTAVPPTPTPLPPIISAGTVGELALSHTFGEGTIRGVDIAPDGSVVAATEGDPAASIGTIRIYETSSGRPLQALEGHESGVWGLRFSPDGRYLASAGRDQTARVWDWAAGTIVTTLNFPNEVAAVRFSPDSRTLAVGGVDEPPGAPIEDAAIWTYAVDTWQPELRVAEYWNIADIAFSPDGSMIVGGGTSRNVRVWRTSDGAELFILYHAGQVGSIAISPDGSTVATATCEESDASFQCIRGGVWLWSLSSGKLIRTLSDFPTGVAEVAYSVDGSVLLAATLDGALRAYATADYAPLLVAAAPAGQEQQRVADMALSADGRFLAMSRLHRIEIWRVGG